MAKTIIAINSGWAGDGSAKNPFVPAVMKEKGIIDYSINFASDPKEAKACNVELEVDNVKLAELQGDKTVADKLTVIRERGTGIRPKPPDERRKPLDAEAAVAVAVDVIPIKR